MKKLLNILFSIAIFILLSLLTISYASRKIVVNTISNVYTKKEIATNILDYIYKEIPKLTVNELSNIQNKLESSPEMNIITNKYMDGILDSMITGEDKHVNVEKEVKSLIDNLTYNMNSYIKEEIKKEVSGINLDNAYEYALDTAKSNISPLMNKIIKMYSKIDNQRFRNNVTFAIILLIVLIIIINKSIFKSIKIISINFIVFGVSSSIGTFLLNKNMYQITNRFIGRTANIDLTPLETISLLSLISGVIVYIVITVIESIIKSKKTKAI